MESTGVIGRIQLTCEAAEIVSQADPRHEFTLEQRGPIQVKGKGNLVTYLVKSKFDFEEKEITYVWQIYWRNRQSKQFICIFLLQINLVNIFNLQWLNG